MAEAKRFFTERDIEELLRPNDKSNADFISNMAFASLLRGREEPQDKTLLALNYPHSAMDNTPLGLGGDDPQRQDTTGIFEELKKLKLKKPTIRNFLINPPSSHAPTSPIPEEMLKDTNLLWYHLQKKDTTGGQ